MPLLERVRGYALLQQGNLAGARQALQASLAAGRTRRDLFEVTLTLLALIQLAGAEGVEPPPEIVSESRSLIASLKLRDRPGGAARCAHRSETRSGPAGPLLVTSRPNFLNGLRATV